MSFSRIPRDLSGKSSGLRENYGIWILLCDFFVRVTDAKKVRRGLLDNGDQSL